MQTAWRSAPTRMSGSKSLRMLTHVGLNSGLVGSLATQAANSDAVLAKALLHPGLFRRLARCFSQSFGPRPTTTTSVAHKSMAARKAKGLSL